MKEAMTKYDVGPQKLRFHGTRGTQGSWRRAIYEGWLEGMERTGSGGDVVDEQAARRAAVVGPRDRAEGLSACRVPAYDSNRHGSATK
jgi:hypothetical protein